MTTPTELLPCPFCGSDDILEFSNMGQEEYQGEPYWANVECRCCRASTAKFNTTIEDAIAAWNTRAALSQPSVDKE